MSVLDDAVPTAAFVASEGERGIEEVTALFADYTGLPAGSVESVAFSELVHPDDLDRAQRDVHASLAARTPIRIDVRLRDRHGAFRWHEIRVVPLPAASHDGRWLGVCIPDRGPILAAPFESSTRLRDELLAGLAHELRTPLSTILGWSRLLTSEGLDDRQLHRGLRIVERNAALQSDLIDYVLDVFRVMSGTARITPTGLSVDAIATEIVGDLAATAMESGVALSVVIGESPVGATDVERLRRAITCLVRHALRDAHSGTTLEVAIRGGGDVLSVCVGPPEADHDRATGIPFERAFPSLHLSLARALVEALGGQVVVRRCAGGTTTDVVAEVPLFEVSSSVATTAGEHESTAFEGSLVGVRVLVVDDARDIQDLVATILRLRKAEVVTASSAREAMEALGSHTIDVLVSDIAMPHEDGLSLVSRARKRFPRLKAIALSAQAFPENEQRALDVGFSRFVSKPVDPERLVGTIASIVSEA